MALSMTVLFVPQIRPRYLRPSFARGLHNYPVAALSALLVRTLAAAQEIACAIDARCYGSPAPVRRITPPVFD